jgi:hypothetical protein
MFICPALVCVVTSCHRLLTPSRAGRLQGMSSASLALAVVALMCPLVSRADTVSVDWLYDFRHATDPQDNPSNFPVIELKVFYPQSFGSFLMKSEIDLGGTSHNASEVYTELSQSIKLGSATLGGLPLFAHFGYSGGLGLFSNAAGGFYIPNAYMVGLEYPFEVRKANCDVFVGLRDTSLARPSHDPMLTVYAERYFFNYRLLIAHSLEAWTTTNEGQGGTSGQPQYGKLASWELESEAWYKVAKELSVGTYVRTTRNVYVISNHWLVYPSIGVRYAF